MSDFVTALRSGETLVMDGAMGTELMRRSSAPGAVASDSASSANAPGSDVVAAVHASYVAATADVLLTNTFLAIPNHTIWQTAVACARSARPRFLLADVGPIEHLTPTIAATILDEAQGTDGVLLETWTSFADLEIFARARPSALPMLVSFTYLHDGLTTFAGATPEECAHVAEQCGAVAIGANCGKEIDMDDMRRIVERYRLASALPIVVRPNAGTPVDGHHPRAPTRMAAELPALLDAGVAMIGGCCGTTPEHIRAFREVVERYSARKRCGR